MIQKTDTAPFQGFSERAIEQGSVTRAQALEILRVQGPDVPYALAEANRVRCRFFGNTVRLCSIMNIKSGNCSEDCAFCAQSAHHKADLKEFDPVKPDAIRQYAEKVKSWGSHLGLVTAGRKVLDDADFETVLDSIRRISASGRVDASFGSLDLDQAMALKRAGLTTYNHNVETARAFYGQIVSTHTYDDRIRTIKALKRAGLKVCSGGIFGMGETPEHRVDFAFEIRDLDVDVIPLNFLHPVPGTKLGNLPPLEPLEALKAIAMVRLVNPGKHINICGGREFVLRDLQSMIFYAGASGFMVGDYLTTQGRSVELDLALLRDLGLEITAWT
jgi:biotin synthase